LQSYLNENNNTSGTNLLGKSLLNDQIRKQAKRGTTARNSSPRTEKPFSKSMGKINHSNNENVNILNTPSHNTS
jgi:hypothetical protein